MHACQLPPADRPLVVLPLLPVWDCCSQSGAQVLCLQCLDWLAEPSPEAARPRQIHGLQWLSMQMPAQHPHGCIWCSAGCYAKHAQFFDLKNYNVVLVDQRGCGRSTPVGCLQDNTTQVAAQMCSNACIYGLDSTSTAIFCMDLHKSLLVKACSVQLCSTLLQGEFTQMQLTGQVLHLSLPGLLMRSWAIIIACNSQNWSHAVMPAGPGG